jgi:hypothetical protein
MADDKPSWDDYLALSSKKRGQMSFGGRPKLDRRLRMGLTTSLGTRLEFLGPSNQVASPSDAVFVGIDDEINERISERDARRLHALLTASIEVWDKAKAKQ